MPAHSRTLDKESQIRCFEDKFDRFTFHIGCENLVNSFVEELFVDGPELLLGVGQPVGPVRAHLGPHGGEQLLQVPHPRREVRQVSQLQVNDNTVNPRSFCVQPETIADAFGLCSLD